MKRIVSCCLAATFVLANAASVSAQTIDDEGVWLAYLGNGDAEELGLNADGWKWWFDGHLRFLDDADGFNQSIVRPGIGYDIGGDSALWAGYGWIRTRPLNGQSFDEHRIWQQ